VIGLEDARRSRCQAERRYNRELPASLYVAECCVSEGGGECLSQWLVRIAGEHPSPPPAKESRAEDPIVENTPAEAPVQLDDFGCRLSVSQCEGNDSPGASAGKEIERVSDPDVKVPLQFREEACGGQA